MIKELYDFYESKDKYDYISVYMAIEDSKECLNYIKLYKFTVYKLISSLEKELGLLYDFKKILDEILLGLDDKRSIEVINKHIKGIDYKVKCFKEDLECYKFEYKVCNRKIKETKNKIKEYEEMLGDYDDCF